MSVGPPAIRLAGIVKRFPGIAALSGVSFDIAAGTCHAICGENGAGKSTLGRILAGITAPDSGTIALHGTTVRFASPRDALTAGVAMVHQELSFCDNLTVGENLCLGALPNRAGFLDDDALRARAAALLAGVGASIDPDRAMHSLSVAEQQLVQIAAAVGEAARVIVFDEPTSSLGEKEVDALYALIARLKASGVTILYVSHRMAEIFMLADDITVLRDGEHVGTWPAASIDEGTLVARMIGRQLEQYFPTHTKQRRGDERLRVAGLRSPQRFENVSFTLHAGEVVGLAGLVGAGRSEIAQAIFGLDPAATGGVFVRGQPVRIRSPRDAMRLGIGLVPEDRKRQGLVLSMTNADNATLPIVGRFATAGWIDRRDEAQTVSRYFERLRVRGRPDAVAGSLSGGNQQKIVLAKWLAAHADILMLDEPTRGVDVGTKAELHGWIDRLAADGAAVLLISSELPELIAVSSRIIVLRLGRVVGELTRADATQDALLRLMAGLDDAVTPSGAVLRPE
jgi:ABC-type sugar transport system ATPase subunit